MSHITTSALKRCPNDEQQFYIDAPNDAVLVACPGSGKTFTCTHRYVSRCAAAGMRGVAYLSYTNTAIDEARRAIGKLGDGSQLRRPHFIGTTDSFLQRFVFTPFIGLVMPEIGPQRLKVFGQDRPAPAALAGSAHFKPHDKRLNRAANYFAWQVSFAIRKNVAGFFEGNATTPISDELSKEYVCLKGEYLRLGFVTHSDMLYWCLEILSKSDRVAKIVAQRFCEIIIDEAQDTSAVQQRVLQILERAGIAISFVGDPDQSVYQFNGAHPAFLRDRHTDSLNPRVLAENRRSSSQIITSINMHFSTKMTWTFDAPPDHGPYVVVGDPVACIDQFAALVRSRGLQFGKAAVLVRDRALKARLSGAIAEAEDMKDLTKRLIEALIQYRSGEFASAANSMLELLRRTFGASHKLDGKAGRVEAWRFLCADLPEPTEESIENWIARVRVALTAFGTARGLEPIIQVSANLTASGLPKGEKANSLLARESLAIAVRTIHDVKGETLESALVFGSENQQKKWLTLSDQRERPIIYVAMTRPTHLLVLGTEDDACAKQWLSRGFARPTP
jgi:DNA helicase-2/ATP-dependent DNA helicase PcrA